MHDPVVYRDAEPGDASALAALFHHTFCETFGHLYSAADLSTFLAGHTAAQWEGQLRDPTIAVRLAEDDAAIGLAKLAPLKLPVEAPRPAVELRQLYVLGRARGSGVAATLMDWAIEQARARGADDLYLSVYTDNPRAQRFYRRFGFVDVGPYMFMVGNHADQDIIMRLSLS